MTVGKICVRSVLTAAPDESVREAARRMRQGDVGTLVVVEGRTPIGVLTDRDVTLRCVAEGLAPESTPVSAVMTSPARCVAEGVPIEDALREMAGIRARRLVVTDDEGGLVGLVALDDFLELLAEEVETVGRLLERRRLLLDA